MRIVDPGHEYEVDSLDGPAPQRIVFVKREGSMYPGNVGHHAGTTTQELLRVCIDRLLYVNRQIACAESEACIGLLRSAILLLEVRAKRRKAKSLDAKRLVGIETLATCATCGHVVCSETRHGSVRNQPAPRSGT